MLIQSVNRKNETKAWVLQTLFIELIREAKRKGTETMPTAIIFFGRYSLKAIKLVIKFRLLLRKIPKFILFWLKRQ